MNFLINYFNLLKKGMYAGIPFFVLKSKKNHNILYKRKEIFNGKKNGNKRIKSI